GQPRDFTLNFTATATGLSVTAVWSCDAALTHSVLSPFGALTDGGIGSVDKLPYLSLQSRND
ncbi:oxidoreductase, partial [Rhizobium ruizarguesonis]